MRVKLIVFLIVLIVSINSNLYPADTPDEETNVPEYVNEIKEIKDKLPTRLHNKYGFQDILFGTSFETVKKALNSKFNHLRIMDSGNKFIWLYDFLVGDKRIDVTFFFDHKQSFYAFEFNPGNYSADKFSTKVRDDGKFLNELFTKKYGKPAQCFNPGFLSIRTGYVTYLCKWNDKDLDIYTSLGVYEFKYFAESHVASKIMSKEYEKFEKNKDIESVKKGSSSF